MSEGHYCVTLKTLNSLWGNSLEQWEYAVSLYSLQKTAFPFIFSPCIFHTVGFHKNELKMQIFALDMADFHAKDFANCIVKTFLPLVIKHFMKSDWHSSFYIFHSQKSYTATLM